MKPIHSRYRLRVLPLLACVLCCGLTVWVVRAQVPATAPASDGLPTITSPLDGLPVREVVIEGLRLIQESYIRNQIQTGAGRSYSADQLQRDISRLLRTGRFIDVTAEPRVVEGQVVVIFRVAEKPEVQSIEFVGAQEIEAKDLLAVLTFAAGDPLDEFEVRQGAEAIQREYFQKGYPFVQVTFDEQAMRQDNRVVYTIVENQRVRVRDIDFEGTQYGEGDLEGQIETKEYFPIFVKGIYDPEQVERDAARLQEWFRNQGFLDAEVSYELQFQDVARENLRIVFRINEGTRYKVGEVRFEGNTLFTGEQLSATMLLRPGDFFVNARLESDIRSMETRYGSQGYIYARITPNWVFSSTPEQVILTLTVNEGNQYRVGWIEVKGNERTQEKVVRREVRIYPDEIYDITKARAAEQRLKDTGLFTEATAEAVGEEPGVRDMLVTVSENPQTNRFIAGIGASSDNGVTGNFEIQNSNFDISDWPRSWEEFFRGRAFRGAGQTMRIQFQPGTELTNFRIDFREPYLNDRPIGFGTSVYLFERGRDGYDEQRYGFSFSFDHKFETGILKDWSGEIAFRNEIVDVNDRVAFAARDIRDAEGSNWISSVRVGLTRDTTDSRFTPTTGYRFHTSYEQAYGDWFYGKLLASFTRHHTVGIDEEDRRSVFSWRISAGQMIGDTPVFDRFYLGGIGSFRGFDFRGISPRQGLRNNRVGGDFMFLAGAEYSFPIWAKAVRGVFFLDTGTVEEDFGISTYRAAAGAGIRLALPLLGTVPMEFNLAYPLSKDSEDNTQTFSFSVGMPFF